MYRRNDEAGPGFFDLSPDQVWTSLDDAYGAVLDLTKASPHSVAAWKLGGTTPLTRKIFNVTDTYFGPLYTHELYGTGAEISAALTECKVELEIACRISEASGDIDAWCLSAEMPSSGIRDLPGRGVTALVADRCAAGALILGPVQPVSTIAQAPEQASLIHEGEALTTGGIGGLTDTPLNIARGFLDIARTHGFAPQAGQWIATGGMSPCVEVPRGGQFSVRVNGVENFSFTLNIPALP